MMTSSQRMRNAADFPPDRRLSWRSHLVRLGLKVMRSSFNYSAPVPELRAAVERSARLMRMPRHVTVQPASIAGRYAEWLIPAETLAGRTILYVHGGGFILGSCATHRALAARLAVACRARGLVFDYRLAPEHPYPAGLDDTVMAYRCLLEAGINPAGIILMGDSAGGYFVLMALCVLRDAGDPLPAGAVCLSAVTDLTESGETITANARRAPYLKPEDLVGTRQFVGESDPASPQVSPLFANLHGLPPLLMLAGGDEILLSDSTAFAGKARAAGVDVTLDVWPGMWHVWPTFAPILPEANRAIARVGGFVDSLLRGAST